MKLADVLNGSWVCSQTPILEPGAGRAWDNWSVFTPGVFAMDVKDGGGRYGMFYIGLSRGSGSWGIGYAQSSDLYTWKKHESNPLIVYEDENDYYGFDSPCVIKKGDLYHLFCEEKKFRKNFKTRVKYMLPVVVRNYLKRFYRRPEEGGHLPLSVRHAEDRYFVRFVSDDLFTWNLHDREVCLEKNEYGHFDCKGLFSPQVHEFDGKYYMFYGGSDGDVTSTGLAMSGDLVSWHRSELSPVLKPGRKGGWDQNNALIVSVLKVEDGYCGFYEGEDGNSTYRIGLAYSYDLKYWEKFEANPIIQPGGRGRFSERMACSPHVFSENGEILLFYTGHGCDMRGCCGVARFEGN